MRLNFKCSLIISIGKCWLCYISWCCPITGQGSRSEGYVRVGCTVLCHGLDVPQTFLLSSLMYCGLTFLSVSSSLSRKVVRASLHCLYTPKALLFARLSLKVLGTLFSPGVAKCMFTVTMGEVWSGKRPNRRGSGGDGQGAVVVVDQVWPILKAGPNFEWNQFCRVARRMRPYFSARRLGKVTTSAQPSSTWYMELRLQTHHQGGDLPRHLQNIVPVGDTRGAGWVWFFIVVFKYWTRHIRSLTHYIKRLLSILHLHNKSMLMVNV